jgi:hypothetical protein
MRGGSYMSKPNKKTANTIGFMIVFSIIVIAVFFYVRTRTTPIFTAPVTKTTELESLMSKDINNEYPSSPKEVLNLYNRYIKIVHSGKLEDDKVNKLADQMLTLYDEELISTKTKEQYLLDLKVEITDYKSAGRIIMNDVVGDSKDTFYWKEAEKEYASLSTSYTIKENRDYSKVYENFILRKDAEGKWKILGWKLTEKPGNTTTE